MAAVCNPSLGTSSSSRCYVSSRPCICPDLRQSSVRLSSEVFKVEIGRSERSLCQSSGKKLSAVTALASQTSVSDPISTPSRNGFSDSIKKSMTDITCCAISIGRKKGKRRDSALSIFRLPRVRLLTR